MGAAKFGIWENVNWPHISCITAVISSTADDGEGDRVFGSFSFVSIPVVISSVRLGIRNTNSQGSSLRNTYVFAENFSVFTTEIIAEKVFTLR